MIQIVRTFKNVTELKRRCALPLGYIVSEAPCAVREPQLPVPRLGLGRAMGDKAERVVSPDSNGPRYQFIQR